MIRFLVVITAFFVLGCQEIAVPQDSSGAPQTSLPEIVGDLLPRHKALLEARQEAQRG